MGAILSFGIKRGKTVKNEKLSKNTFFLDRIDRFCVRKIDTITVDRKDRKIEFPTLMKTEPDAVGAYTTEYVGMASGPNTCKQKPDIYLCIRSCRDRLGFYAEIQVIFGTVCHVA